MTKAYGVDERCKHGFTDQYGPRLNNFVSWETASLFSIALHFLPVTYLAAMAAAMQAKGLSKYNGGQGDRYYHNWKVTLEDLYQWIGVWIYMLAFPQAGSRRDYFTERPGGYGPRHRISDYLRLGRNGEKGAAWFERMHACFTLPTYGDERDPFNPTRRWWDSLRDGFYNAVVCSWLMTLDESMVRWMGVGMPGLMVILRKPTPIGLELHTLCCALSGILVWFEVYEGKDAMATQEYCDRYPKSVALTLRMVKRFFSTGRVLIADSWFGSVACALALFQHGVFAVMNVKTNTKGYPKDELMAEVDEIKGKTDEARQRRRERRGKQIAFVKTVKVGSRQVTLTAGGHNKKVPLLLISTASSMLPGTEHLKTWQVNKPDGSVEYRSIRTKQPMMHALYRKWMNVVDVMNKLRQGVVSMADVWHTTSWHERHFAEGLGFWEVNVYKALVYFYQPTWLKLPHGEFRARLAWAMMTLGKEPYPADVSADQAAAQAADFTPMVGSPGGSMRAPPLPGGCHTYIKVDSKHGRTCGYCGKIAYQHCTSCEATGLGCIYVCGMRSARKGECMAKHVTGAPLLHANFKLSDETRLAAAAKRRARANGEEEDGAEGADGDDEDDDERPIQSPLRQSNRSIEQLA